MFALLTFFVGLFLGWFFLNPPAFAHSLLAWLLERVPALTHFVKK